MTMRGRRSDRGCPAVWSPSWIALARASAAHSALKSECGQLAVHLVASVSSPWQRAPALSVLEGLKTAEVALVVPTHQLTT
jgi:hypothetical protein